MTKSFLCAGELIRTMLLQRHSLCRETYRSPKLSCSRPLFETPNKGQLTQRAVMTFMRKILRQGGFPHMDFGNHSCRIGGFNELLRLGIPIEKIVRVGGWSSDAWKVYVRIQQRDTQDMLMKMVAHEGSPPI